MRGREGEKEGEGRELVSAEVAQVEKLSFVSLVLSTRLCASKKCPLVVLCSLPFVVSAGASLRAREPRRLRMAAKRAKKYIFRCDCHLSNGTIEFK